MAPDAATIGRKSSISRSVLRGGRPHRTGILVEEIGTVSSSHVACEQESDGGIDYRRAARSRSRADRGGYQAQAGQRYKDEVR